MRRCTPATDDDLDGGMAEILPAAGRVSTSRMRTLLGWLAVVSAFAVPALVLGIVLLAVPDTIAEIAPPERPVVVAATEERADGATPAQATLVWVDGPALVAPQWSGLVTAVVVQPGDRLDTGSVVASIDGVRRLAVASPSPFYRSLQTGDSGDDVAMLRQVLADLGLAPAGTGRNDWFDWTMRVAVQRLEARLTGRPPASSPGVFQPGWFAWLPQRGLVVSEVALEVGSPAPGPGSPAARGAPVLRRATVEPQQSSGGAADGPRELVVAGQAFPLGDGLVLRDPTVLAALAAGVPPRAQTVQGQYRLQQAVRVTVVPATAVTADRAGRLCVWLPAASGYQARSVQVAGGAPSGVTYLSSGVSAGEEVLANPAGVVKDVRCP